MVATTERRIAALETASPAEPLRVVKMNSGESEADCRLRLGISADAANVLFICRVIVKPGEL